VSTASAAATPDRIAELQGLIMAHTVAHVSFSQALDREEECSRKYFGAHPKELSITLSTGKVVTVGVSDSLDREIASARRTVAAHYADKRKSIRALFAAHEQSAEQAISALRQLEAADQRTLRRMILDEIDSQKAAGLREAVKASNAAGQAETDAAASLLSFPCLTEDEIRLRSSYVLSDDRRSSGRVIFDALTSGDTYLLKALLGSHLLEGGEA
jgi:hypothetical protein